MHSKEENKFPKMLEKRKLKTPSQVEALENFYNEHKYPSESLKLQLAEEIGLSEKQISGLFCHRRLKDKKLVKDEGCVNGKQNHLSGSVHDLSSGLRQESCSSTKEREYKHFDSKEVESRRVYAQTHPAAVRAISCDKRTHNLHNVQCTSVDNKSSGSSSASLERVIEYGGCDYIRPSRYSCIDGNYLRNSEGKMRGHIMGSGYGYSSMQENIENPVISAVKRRLGRNYVEDGPPLAVEFQSLPPGAFDSPLKDPVHEPHYMGDPTKHYSVGISKVQREQNVARVCKTHSTEMHAYGSNLKGADFSRTFKGKHNRDEFISFSTRTSLFGNYTKYAPGRNSVKDKKENPIQVLSYLNDNNHGKFSKYTVDGRCNSSADHQVHLGHEKLL